MVDQPFGNHPAFEGWGTARDISDGQVTFGGTVIPHLMEGIAEFLAQPASRTDRNYRARVAVGVVPWFNNMGIARLLARMEAASITIDKRATDTSAAQWLNREARPVVAGWLGMDTLGLPDEHGEPPLLGPTSTMPGDALAIEPVRVAGYRLGSSSPLLHAKILVLCHLDYLDYGEQWDSVLLRPVRVWIGSANWTESAPNHLEVGLWSTDEALAQSSLEFVSDIIRVSEPLGSATSRPQPQYVEADWDEDAMWEAAMEAGEIPHRDSWQSPPPDSGRWEFPPL